MLNTNIFYISYRSKLDIGISFVFVIQSVLAHIDSVLYVDTDTLFLAPLDDIWSHFQAMNESQMAALAPEHEDPNTGWYNRFARHPFYGKLGTIFNNLILV